MNISNMPRRWKRYGIYIAMLGICLCLVSYIKSTPENVTFMASATPDQKLYVQDPKDIPTKMYPLTTQVPSAPTVIPQPFIPAVSTRPTTSAYKPQPNVFPPHMLASIADDAKTIIVACLDNGFLEMGLNLYETSIKQFNITNYLFVGIDNEVCTKLTRRSIQCFTYSANRTSNGPSNYGSKEFNFKAQLKTRIVLQVLLLGYDVILTDVDIVFLKNPLESIKTSCRECDIAISSDGGSRNSGFYYARATRPAIELHKQACRIGEEKGDEVRGQTALNSAINKMKAMKVLNLVDLPKEKYQYGKLFFREGHRIFKDDNPCDSCVIVHNNWIVSEAAKRYRFKEMGMWLVDTDGYYSDAERKYLSYECNLTKVNSPKSTDKENLMVALYLGHLLNRTTILSAFSCKGCKAEECKGHNNTCSLGNFLNIENFDKYMGTTYREHLFLSHPKVPGLIKSQITPTITFWSNSSTTPSENSDVIVRGNFSINKSMLEWKSYEKTPVLNFCNLGNLFPWFKSLSDKYITNNIRKACKA